MMASEMFTFSPESDMEVVTDALYDDYYYQFGGGVFYDKTLVAFVYLIAAVGMLTNGFALVPMIKYKELRAHSANIFILNQTVIDLASCVVLIITYGVYTQLDSWLVGRFGDFLCVMFMKEQAFWMLFSASTFNLIALSCERYFMIVHSIAHRNHFRKYHVYIAIALVWGIPWLFVVPDLFIDSHVVNGRCMYKGAADPTVYGFVYLTGTFIVPFVILIYCYSRMLIVLFTRAKKVRPSDTTGTDASKSPMSKTQKNLTRTMILVSVAFLVTILPYQVYYIMRKDFGFAYVERIYYAVQCVSIANLVVNPVIYIFSMEKFQRCVRNMLGYKMTEEAGAISLTTHTT